MSKLKRVLTALAVVFCFGAVWAGLPTITVSGNDVTISTDSGSHGNIGTNNGGYDTLTIPAATDLASGTVLRIKSISLGARTSGTAAPASVVLAGVSSAAAEVTTSGYTDRDKYTYVFTTPCLMKVGTGSTISFRNSAGEQANVGLAASLTGSTDQDDYLFTTLRSTSGNNKWSVLTEIVAEKVTGFINETKDGFNTTVTSEKVYVSGVTGYLNTVDAFGFGNVDELVVVDGEYTYGYKVVNGNSPQDNNTRCNRAVAFKKLSGTGTITNGDHGNGPTPVMGVCDSSEFAGSINIGSATTRLSVLFCTEDEISAGIQTSLGNSLYTLFTSESNRSRIYVSPGRTTANNAVVTVPAGKTWTAVNGIENRGELVVDGTVSCKIVNSGALTVNGTVTGTISGSGTVVVSEGATISSFGSQRDFTGWTIDSSVPVKITMTSEEYGKGSVSVTGATGISTITVLAPDGTTDVGTITPEEGAGTLETGVKTTGLATWCDYEFNGDKSNSGVDTTGLESDVNTTTYPEIFNNQMLYTYTHPWRNISYPNSWTAVVRCTVPELENAVVVMFGTYGAGAIGLIAGPNPEEQMLLVSTPGNTATTSEAKHFTTLATMNVKDATTAQHVYVFTKNGTTVNVYCDGENVLSNYELASATLGGGLQIGSLHGGVTYNNVDTGLVRFGAGEAQISSLSVAQQQNARIDCMRMFDYIVSPEQIAALSVEFPAVKLYRATVAANADTTWGNLSWTPAWDGGNTQSKVILTTVGDATVALPESITVDEVQLDLAEGSTLTLTGPGSLAITQPVTIEDGTLKLTGTVTLTQNTALNGSVVFDAFTAAGTGALKLSNGATVGVESGSVVVTPLGAYTCAEGTVVDSAYTGDGVKLIPLTSAVVSITQSGTTLYYSNLDTAVTTLMTIGNVSDDVSCVLLNGTTWPTTPQDYAGMLRTLGYYVDGDGTLTKAVARITSTPYPTLTAAVDAATDGATVTLLLASSEAITLNKAITLDENGKAFNGTLTGNGTLTFAAFRNNPSITFNNWEGTVVLPEFAANGTILNKYGVTGSTVVLKGITAGWFGETSSQKMDVNPVLQLDGDVTIKGFSTSWDYTFAEITGTGNFVLDPTDNSPQSATITKVAEGFSGIITNTTDKTLTISTLERADGTSTTAGTRLLATGGDVVASVLKIGGEASTIVPMTKNKGGEDDGIYVPVIINVPEVANTTVAVTGDATGDQPGNYEVVPGDTITVTYTVVDGYEHTSGDLVYVIDSASTESVIVPDIVTTPYVASITVGEATTKYTSLQAALDAISGETEEVTIELLANASLELSRNGNVLGGDAVTKITVDGNGKTINFVRNGTWAQVNTANGASLVLNDVNLTSEFTGTMTQWQSEPLQNPNHNIAFNCEVELNNVTSSTALSFFKDAALDTVTISETVDVYSIWIHTTASTVAIKDLVVDSPAGRGIKVDDSFVAGWGGTPSATSISIDGATFTTKNRKAAVLVRSICATTVAASGTIDISGVPADTTNLVWVDEASAAKFDLVTVTGATVAIEPGNYVATVSDGTTVKAYYTTLQAAITAAAAGDTIKVIADNTMTGNAIAFEKSLTLDLNGFTTTHMGDGHAFEPTSSATFTITDTSDGAAGKVVSGSKIVLSGSPCTFTLTAGTLQSESVPVYIWGNGPASERVVNINGGKLVCGSTTTSDSCIMVTSGTIRMSAGVIESVCCGFEGTTVNVSGGNVTVGADKVFRRSTDRATGGTFNRDVSEYCATGKICVSNGDGTYTVRAGTWVAQVGSTKYETLAAAVADATTGDTVKLLTDVTLDARVEPNLGNGTTLTIDLNEKTITRTGTSGNGSVFDVKSGTVTIKNGTIDCTQDDTAIAEDGVYAITSRSGSTVVLETLTVTVDSECGACAYPFSGSTMTIKSGTYSNTTTTPYRYKTEWTGMAVNQPNNAVQILFLEGGTYSKVDPKLGDDSGKWTNFCAAGKTTKQVGEAWEVVNSVAEVVNGKAYASLAEAVANATSGQTVKLLADVTLDARVEPNLGADTTLTIDLDDHTITRTGTSGNGSVFDVKSGTVTIKNGTIDCTQDDTAIAEDGVYAITSRSGSTVVLETLTVTVDSECGACAYPFSGSTMTIKSGTYENTTTTPYRYKTAWTGMAVNQPNVTDKLLTIEGGRFKQVDPKLGDDSGKVTNFIKVGYTTELDEGYYKVVEIPPVDPTATAEDPVEIVVPATATDTEIVEAIVVTPTSTVAADWVANNVEVEPETYTSYFTKTVVSREGTTAEVKIELNKETVMPVSTDPEGKDTEDVLSESLEITDPTEPAAVELPATATKPGLYYSIEVCDAIGFNSGVTEGTRVLATGEAVNVTPPSKATTTSGIWFYRVKVSATPISATP